MTLLPQIETCNKCWKTYYPTCPSCNTGLEEIGTQLLQSELATLKKENKVLRECVEENIEEEQWAYDTIDDKLCFGLPEVEGIKRRESRAKGVFLTCLERSKKCLAKIDKTNEEHTPKGE